MAAVTIMGQHINGPDVRLPIEVQERIISFHSDSWDIANCALVCKTWLPFSRYMLYDTVHIRSSEASQGKFFKLLSDPPDDLIPYLKGVRQLCLQRWIDMNAEQEDGVNALSFPNVLQGIQLLSGLTALEFKGIDWRKPWLGSVWLEGRTHHSSLTSLDLYDCTFSNIDQFQRLILEFPKLSKLSVHHVNSGDALSPPGSHLHARKRLRPKLTSLDLSATNVSAIDMTRWLLDSGLVRELSELLWESWKPNTATDDVLRELINVSGEFLHYLVVWPHSLRPLQDMSALTNLKELHIGSDCPISLKKDDIALFKQLLYGLSTHSLEAFSMQFTSNDTLASGLMAHEIDAFRDIDNILAGSQFKNLKCFSMSILFVISSADIYAAVNVSSSTSTSNIVQSASSGIEAAADCAKDEKELYCSFIKLARSEIQQRFKCLSTRGALQLRDVILGPPGHTSTNL